MIIGWLYLLGFTHPFDKTPIEERFVGSFSPDTYDVSQIDVIQVKDDRYAVSVHCQRLKAPLTPQLYPAKRTVGKTLAERGFAQIIGSTVTTEDSATRTVTKTTESKDGQVQKMSREVQRKLNTMTKEEVSVALRNLVPVAEWVTDSEQYFCTALGLKLQSQVSPN
jgi:hypothetical protein